MNAIAAIRPTELHRRRVRLTTGPAAVAEARGRVRAAICAWDVPVDPDVAVLLTSELMTNAIRHEPSETVTLAVTYSCGQFRVDVHDTSRALPLVVDAPGDAETGRGLMLVATLAAEWGYYRTPAGKAVYFTLVFPPELAVIASPGAGGFMRGDGEPSAPAGSPSPLTARAAARA